MALSEALEELLGTMSEEDRVAYRQMLDKYPGVKESHLRQSDYSRQNSELQREREAFKAETEQDRKQIAEWYTWHEKQAEREGERERAVEAAKAEAETLRKQIAESTSRQGNGTVVDQTQIRGEVEQALAGRKFITGDEVERAVAAALAKQAEPFMKQVGDRLNGQAEFNRRWTRAEIQHQNEFGKPLDDDAFMKYMAEKKHSDPLVGYDQFVAKERRDREMNKIREDIRKEVEAEYSAKHIPGSGAVPESEMSPIELMQRGKLPQDITAPMGSSASAQLLADELRKMGKVQ